MPIKFLHSFTVSLADLLEKSCKQFADKKLFQHGLKSITSREVDEIYIRGLQMISEYWQKLDKTAKIMAEDGFFRSSDMRFMDDQGYTKIVDRKKNMILVSRFQRLSERGRERKWQPPIPS